ncbi:MAG: FAD-binding domain-containing protein [Bacteroidota bacterium]|nr:FAD-binding domain-containing protein [Bacteroidota bacterium]
MSLRFEPTINAAWKKIDNINPKQYANTRNYLDGAVTYLSPYISRGVISTKQVVERLLQNGHKLAHMEVLLKELAWRDYFQRVAQHKNLQFDIKQRQGKLNNHQIPEAIVQANTGIEAIDTAILNLYADGYMHNHLRMYTASIVCNIAQSHWKMPAQWMYYHLLDGDFASNICSWQWVAGANSSKLYFANQENINTYTNSNQQGTFLDCSYEDLPDLNVPKALMPLLNIDYQTVLPPTDVLQINPNLPTLVYNYYNLDPNWHATQDANRILIIEPSFFQKFPVAPHCMAFMLALAKQIPNMQVHLGTFQSVLNQTPAPNIFFKEHPLNIGYQGIQEPRDWMVPQVSTYLPSFFAYWKKMSKHLYANYTS